MNILKSGIALSIALGILLNFSGVYTTQAQTKKSKPKAEHEFDPSVFPALKFKEIPGAPTLSAPRLITGESGPVKGEGMGWASPAFFDVDQDGKKDLLIGEFGSGIEHRGMSMGNLVRVYKNIGTAEKPEFSDDFHYLTFSDKTISTGTPISIFTWCCLSFTPRFVDLDGDGIEDLVSGHYDPGYVTWFKGTESGFLTGQKLPQFGDTMLGVKRGDVSKPWTDPDNWAYWVYSAVTFGDMTGDGKQDMIVGGNTLRLSKNIGTKNSPAFGRRELLLDISGKPLVVESGADTTELGYWKNPSYGYSIIPYVVDWNNDGIPDILATNNYGYSGSVVLTYFQGERTKKDGLRFHPGVALFESTGGGKAFPGGYMHLYVTDWNNDGIQDVVLGTSIPFLGGKPNEALAWGWGGENYSLGINPAYYSSAMRKEIDSYFAKTKDPKHRQDLVLKFYGNEDYKDLFNQGFVYVMLGENK